MLRRNNDPSVFCDDQPAKAEVHDSVQPCEGVGACLTFQDRIKALTITLQTFKGTRKFQTALSKPLTSKKHLTRNSQLSGLFIDTTDSVASESAVP